MVNEIVYTLLGTTAAAAIASPFFLNWLADGNILYTKVKEGTAKAMMRGKSLNHIVLSLRGWHLNDPDKSWFDSQKPVWEVLNDGNVNCDSRSFLTKWLGIYFVGIPPFRNIYNYMFRWNEMKLNEKSGKDQIWTRQENTDFVFVVPFPYIIILDEAETCDRLPVDVQYQLTVRVTNPFKALFETENWMEAVTGAANAAARNFVGSNTYAELVSETHSESGDENDTDDEINRDSFSVALKKLNHELVPGSTSGIQDKFGVRIEAADIQRVDISGEHSARIRAATVTAYVADQEAYATEKAGTAEAATIRAIGLAKADAVRAMGQAEGEAIIARLAGWNNGGPLNALIAQVDAMQANTEGKTIIWANNPFISKTPGLAGALDALGITTLEGLKKYIHSAGDTPTTEREEDA